jgi:hypothetical protein
MTATPTRVTHQDILDGTITDTDVAVANVDGIAATASMRTLGTGAQQASAGTHTHTGGRSYSAKCLLVHRTEA